LHHKWCIEKSRFCPTLESVICLIRRRLREFLLVWCRDLVSPEFGRFSDFAAALRDSPSDR
jgi:hypothetical protein